MERPFSLTEDSRNAEEPGLDSQIFIVGAPRSGTTLLRNMLNRHPAIAICRETDFQRLVHDRRRAFGSISDFQNRHRLVREYLSTPRIQRLRLNLPELEQMLLREGTSYEALFAALLSFYAQTHGKRRCGEKTPRHALFTETLCQWYPGARVIHLLRDPRDVVASLLRMPWADRNVLGNARLWLRSNLAAARSRHRPQYLMVRYEELVTNPEEELVRVCAFVGEEFAPSMLVSDRDPNGQQPWYRRAEERVTTERIGKWREQLTSKEAALVEWFVGRHLQTFGYEPATHAPAGVAIAWDLCSTVFQAARRHVEEFPAARYSFVGSRQLAKEEAAKERCRNRQLARIAISEEHL
jgi:hypothetical protein